MEQIAYNELLIGWYPSRQLQLGRKMVAVMAEGIQVKKSTEFGLEIFDGSLGVFDH